MTPDTEPSSAGRPPETRGRKRREGTAREEDPSGLNGIERGRAPRVEPQPRAGGRKSKAAESPAKQDAGSRTVPAEIRERFIGIGANYYFPDGAAAFTDHGARLTTASENTEVIRSLIAIAQAREWGEIKVTGTERFRKEAWFAGRIAGLEVRGYKPSEFEQERLVRAIARREGPAAGSESATATVERRDAPAAAPGRPPAGEGRDARAPEISDPIKGRLVDHGRATYQHAPKEPMSYYVRIETERGDRELWGVDLERAFRDSLSRPTIGDEVIARTFDRSRWVVERSDFLAERAAAARVFRDTAIKASQAVKEHPELQGSYLQLQAAQLGAERDIRDPQDQARFIARARAAIAETIERGEPLEPVRMRERAKTPVPEPSPAEPSPTR